MDTTEIPTWVSDNSYTDYRVFPSGRNAAIRKLLFTYAIFSDMDEVTVGGRWCYSSYKAAKQALEAWSGEDDTEPQGWHRHPATGRRREGGDPNKETINW